MLTAKVEDTDKIMGLAIGADDYITKPFNPLEVVARVKTQLRRYVNYNNSGRKIVEETGEHDIKGLVINKNPHKCTLYGKEILLTPIEFSILWEIGLGLAAYCPNILRISSSVGSDSSF